MRTKKICQNPNHPFKQKWYWYEDTSSIDIDDPDFCTSCMSYFKFLKSVLKAISQLPAPTLYGDREILPTEAQMKHFIEEIFDEL